MTAEDALASIEKILPPGSLNEVTALVFRQAWEGDSYAKIAQASGYNIDYIRQVAASLWKSLSQVWGVKVSKKNFRARVLQYLEELQPSKNAATSNQQDDKTQGTTTDAPSLPIYDWGTAPDVDRFYGRTQELDRLQRYIVTKRCRLLALLGLGGIGKTTLSVKIAEQVRGDFDCIIWRSLRNSPTLDIILGELVAILSGHQETQASVSQLLNYFRASRCLVVLDNLETILKPGKTGYYRPGYEDYGDLFRVLGETTHQSCILLTSREKPPEIAAFEGFNETVRSVNLSGSPETAQAILQARDIRGTDAQQQQLCQYYGHNPLSLNIVASSIHDLFDGDLAAFLQQETVAFNGIRRLLNSQFQRLTAIEKSITIWLAINREWTSMSELERDFRSGIPKFKLLEALESLTWRSLVEKQGGRYTQQPVVMEYVTDNLIEEIVRESIGLQLDGFHRYALTKTTVKDYIRESQLELILDPIARQLEEAFPSTQALEKHLQRILEVLRQTLQQENIHQDTPGRYGPGNLINLCVRLKANLTGYDFSRLPIWQVDFSQVALRGANLAHAECAQSIFTQSLGNILQVAYSPDGKLFATGDTEGILQLWRTHDTQPQIAFFAHSSWLTALAFSSDGEYLATGSDDGAVRLWNPNTGTCCHTLPVESSWIGSVAFSPDGKWLAVALCGGDPFLWEIGTQRCITFCGHQGDVATVQFSPDGENIASGSYDGTLKLWSIKTQTCWQTLTGHGSVARTVAFSPDGRTLASGSDDRTVKLWDLQTGKCLHAGTVHRDAVWCVKFHPNGQMFASSSSDRTIRLWDAHRGQCLKTLQGHRDEVNSIAFSPDGRTLLSGSQDQTAIVWEIPSGNRLGTVRGYVNYIYSLDWKPLTPEGDEGDEGDKGDEGDRFSGDLSPSSCDSSSNLLASSSTDQTIRIWDTQNGCCIQDLQGHQSWVFSVAWSRDGRQIASSSSDGTLRLWNPQTGQCQKILQGHGGFVFRVTWSRDGRQIASSSSDGNLRLWNPQTGQCLQTLAGHQHWVFSVTWSRDGRQIASGGADCTARVWDTRSGKCLKVLQGDRTWVWGVAWSPDGQMLAFGNGRILQLVDAIAYETLKTFIGHTEPLTYLAFGPDGKTIASASFDRTVRLWDVGTGKCLQVLEGHTGAVFPVAFRGDNRILASSGEDGTIRLWDAISGECLQTLRVPRPYEGTNITGIEGLTQAQQHSLKELGAVQI